MYNSVIEELKHGTVGNSQRIFPEIVLGMAICDWQIAEPILFTDLKEWVDVVNRYRKLKNRVSIYSLFRYRYFAAIYNIIYTYNIK